MNILLTDGASYIGSHTIIELDKAGHRVVVVDNLVNSNLESLRRVAKILGKEIPIYEVDVRDKEVLSKVFDDNKFDAVIHFVGLKAVGESVSKPLEYYHNNMKGTFILLDVMRQHQCMTIFFSSSATVYANPAIIHVVEECPKGQLCCGDYMQLPPEKERSPYNNGIYYWK